MGSLMAMWNTMDMKKPEARQLGAAYVEGLLPAVSRLRQRTRWQSSEELDLSLESLNVLTRWFLDEIGRRDDGATAELPAWWDPKVKTWEGDKKHGIFDRSQLALIDEVQAYLGLTLIAADPDARWDIYQGGRRDFKNGKTMLHHAGKRPFPVLIAVYGQALDKVEYDKNPSADVLSKIATEWLYAEPS
jgi:hypothetical protein